MALTTFWGWTAVQLLAELTKAQTDLMRGGMLITAGGPDINTAREIQANARERIAMIQQALYELDPDTYEDFALVGQNQTVGTFSS